MSLVDFINAETTPQNGIASYSTSQGNAQIIFELAGSDNMMVDLRSIRLCSNCTVLKTNKQGVNNFGVYNNTALDGTSPTTFTPNPIDGPQTPSAGVAPAYEPASQNFIDIDTRSAFASIINSIVIEDFNSNVLEAVYNYPQTMNKIMSLTVSQDDSLTKFGADFGLTNGGKKILSMTKLNSSTQLAMKLYTGLLNGKPLPYSLVGGRLRITITLSSPQSTLFGGALVPFEIGGDHNHASGSYFDLSNVKLTYKNIVLPMDAPVQQSYTYSHFSSLNSTINSSNNQNMFNPNCSNALTIFSSFIPSNKLNSYDANGVEQQKLLDATGEPKEIIETTFLRNNIRTPLAFPINEREYTAPVSGPSNLDVQRQFYYQSSIVPLWEVSNTLMSPATESYGGFSQVHSTDTTPVYGVAVRYDTLKNETGRAFNNGSSFMMRIQSQLDGTLPNEIYSNVYAIRRLVKSSSGGVVVIN